MYLKILETDFKLFLEEAAKLETSNPEGRWRYFKFIDSNKALGLFESQNEIQNSVKLHPDFFKFFLGTFSPELSQNIAAHQLKSFSDFCVQLNELLFKEEKIYDLSVQNKWIWSQGKSCKIPSKLFSFMEFN